MFFEIFTQITDLYYLRSEVSEIKLILLLQGKFTFSIIETIIGSPDYNDSSGQGDHYLAAQIQ
jgi:hypothetical protein